MKNNKNIKWEVVNSKKPKSTKEVLEVLLENRGLENEKLRKEFLNPKLPYEYSLKDLEINISEVDKSLERIKKAIKKQEKIIIYGDYDADGVCSTAILWETLYALTKKVTPFLPDRFVEGYGINPKGVEKLKNKNPDLSLIITVDNGIVADSGIEKARELGIDVIITDHHQKGEKYPNAFSVVHTDKLSGSGIAWVFAREIVKQLANPKLPNFQSSNFSNGLELAAIGTIADQLPLVGPNRSIVKFGLEALNNTVRPGLVALFEEASIKKGAVGTYEVNYLIAPRINAMGRLKNATDSLRLLCTSNKERAKELAMEIGKTNKDRQEIVDKVLVHARELALKKEWRGVIVLADESYHEGVIGLAAGKLVEEFGRPAIVLSKGIEHSKASARSVSGFNIIENIRKMESYILGGGGHPMAAGFSIETSKIETFIAEFDKLTEPLLTSEILQKKVKADCELDFSVIRYDVINEIKKFEPSGMGNPIPVFITDEVIIADIRTVGSTQKHLKLRLKQGDKTFDAIYFNGATRDHVLNINDLISVAYNLDENIWNGNVNLQLKVKDIHVS